MIALLVLGGYLLIALAVARWFAVEAHAEGGDYLMAGLLGLLWPSLLMCGVLLIPVGLFALAVRLVTPSRRQKRAARCCR